MRYHCRSKRFHDSRQSRASMFRTVSIGLFLLAASSLAQPSAAAELPPPNVVVIFIDDMGYADINPFGDNKYKTPHLNRMAAEGRQVH